MTQGLSGWETTRLSKHFILLDFLADREVYRRGRPLERTHAARASKSPPTERSTTLHALNLAGNVSWERPWQ